MGTKYNKASYFMVLLFLMCCCGCATDISAWDACKFTAGAASACVIHEGSHYVVSKAQSNELDFNGLIGNTERDPNTTLCMAGLYGNAITSEAIIRIKPKKRDPFWTGLLWASAFEEFYYPVFKGNSGDFHRDFNNKIYFRVGFTLHSLSILWRELID